MCIRDSPFIAAIAQFVEGAAHQQELRLGGDAGALEQARKRHVADLDHAVRGFDAHQRQRTDGAAAGQVDDGMVERVAARLRLGLLGSEGCTNSMRTQIERSLNIFVTDNYGMRCV